MNKSFIDRFKKYFITQAKSEAIYLDDLSLDQTQTYHFILPDDNFELLKNLTQRCLKKYFNLHIETQIFQTESEFKTNPTPLKKTFLCYVFTYKNYIDFEHLRFFKTFSFFFLSYAFSKHAFFKTYISFLSPHQNDTKTTLFKIHQSMMATVHGPYLQDSHYTREKLEKKYFEEVSSFDNKLSSTEVQAILKDMVGSFNQSLLCLASILVSLFKKIIFKHVRSSFSSKTRLRKHLSQSSVVYVPNHKSHIDYLFLSYCLHTQGLFPPHIAAGINLSFFPVGSILKRLGAFFIKRSIGSNKHYAFLLSQYIDHIIKEKIPQAVFFEGGRSRSGKLLNPKLGIITYQLQALKKTSDIDIIFVPVTINYDFTPELTDITRQLSGEKKKKENIFNFILHLPRIFKKCGNVNLHFHAGISAQEFFKDQEIKKNNITILSKKILHTIASKTLQTHGYLFALILFQYHQQGFSQDRFFSKLNLEKDYLNCLTLFHPHSVSNYKKHFKRMVSVFISQNILLQKKGNLSIQAQRLAMLFYLRNTSVHSILNIWLLNNPSCPCEFKMLLSASHPALNIENPKLDVQIQPEHAPLIHQYLQLEFKYIDILCKRNLGALSKTQSEQWIHPTLLKLFDQDFKRIRLNFNQEQWHTIDAYNLTLINNT